MHLQAPGTLHCARWMAKLLYFIKIVMLAGKIMNKPQRGAVFTSERIQKALSFLYCWGMYHGGCTSAADGPVNDLMLLQKLQLYEDDIIGDAALNAFRNRMWYYSEEL